MFIRPISERGEVRAVRTPGPIRCIIIVKSFNPEVSRNAFREHQDHPRRRDAGEESGSDPRVTKLLVDVLGKNPATTMVLIEEVETDNWGIGGETVTARRKQGK